MTTAERPDVSIASPAIGNREKAAVERVLDSGQLAAGEEVHRFEDEFADFCGAEHAVATVNGTAALHTALAAAGIGQGDTVITTPFTFIATANAVRFVGAEPIFADIDPESYNISLEAVESLLRARDGDVDAVLAVHLYGLPAPMDRLRELAEDYDITLVEDAAQAHGARYRGEPVGAIADVGCFSFYPTKNMTTGEGGMVVTDDREVAERARRFIDHGRDDSYRHVSVGYNYRMTDMAAAVGRVQLDRLPTFVDSRRENAARLTEALEDTPLVTPAEPDHVRHAYHQYTIRCSDRDSLRERLSEAGVGTGVYYPRPVHEQPAYDGVRTTLPAAERAAEEVLSVPVHPDLSATEVDAVASTVRSLVESEG